MDPQLACREQTGPVPASSGAPARLCEVPIASVVGGGATAGLRPTGTLGRSKLEGKDALEDAELVERARAGDEAAFRVLVEKYQRPALAVALSVLRDENDAREVVQEAFLRVHRSLDRFTGQSAFFTWLYRIVSNLCIDLLRKPHRRELERREATTVADAALGLLSNPSRANPLQEVFCRELRSRLTFEIDALPPYHRGVIVMREVQGMSYEDMARVMGVSKGTIMSRLFHARRKLQIALRDVYDGRGDEL